MYVLGLDTTLKHCSAAITLDGSVVAKRMIDLERGHAEHLAPLMTEILREAGIRAQELDRVGVVVGPGGFTGIRVGLSFARGLVIAHGIGVIGVNSLEALARSTPSGGSVNSVAPVIDARRGEVYAALYDCEFQVEIEPFVASPISAQSRLERHLGQVDVRFVGSGAALLPGNIGQNVAPEDVQIDPAVVARVAGAARPPNGPPAPLYLRRPDAKPTAASANTTA